MFPLHYFPDSISMFFKHLFNRSQVLRLEIDQPIYLSKRVSIFLTGAANKVGNFFAHDKIKLRAGFDVIIQGLLILCLHQ